jgi:hypothetical protein
MWLLTAVFGAGTLTGAAGVAVVALQAYDKGYRVGRQTGMWQVLDAWAVKAGVNADALAEVLDQRMKGPADGTS